MRRSIAGLFIVAVFTFSTLAYAATPIPDPATFNMVKYLDATPEANGNYGESCDLSENFMLVGAPFGANEHGGYRLYRKTPDSTWELDETKNYDSGGARFGQQVAIANSVMAIAGPLRDIDGQVNAGSVRLRTRTSTGAWSSEQEISAPTPENGGLFGFALDAHGSTVAVGGPYMNDWDGMAFVYTNDGSSWVIESTIEPPADADGYFGDAIALNSRLLAVGANDANAGGENDAGEVCIYERTEAGWTLKKKLNSSPSFRYRFGLTLSMDENWLLVSDIASVDGQANAGRVHVYDLTQDSIPKVATLTSDTPQADAQFGYATAVDGNLAVIAATHHDKTGLNNCGRVTIYQYDGANWSFVRELPYYDAQASGYFAKATALSRNHIACGVPDLTHDGAARAGAVFMYDINQSVMINGSARSDYMGQTVGICQTHMAATAPYAEVGSLNSAGQVQTYRRKGSDWVAAQILTEPKATRAANNQFGRAMHMHGDRMIVSAPYADQFFSSSGNIYIYKRNGDTWEVEYSDKGSAQNHRLGFNVAIDDDFAAATVYHDATGETELEIFQRQSNGGWKQMANEIKPSLAGDINFGCSIAIESNLMVVGANECNVDKGGVFVYQFDNGVWNQIQAGVSGSTIRYGTAVGLAGKWIAIGTPGNSSTKGVVYLFTIAGQDVQYSSSLQAPEGVNGDQFGYDLAFADNGNALIVSAYTKHLNDLEDVGATYTYRHNSETDKWVYDGTTYPPDSDSSLTTKTYYGKNIAAFGNTVVAGMYGNNGGIGSQTGGAAVYEITPRVAPADFDGDGITDIGCYYAPGGNWYVYKSAERALWLNKFGYSGTIPFVDDFDGDWVTDFGCFDSTTGNWFFYGSTRGFWVDTFGGAGTTRITGDFDGDSISDYGYFDAAIPGFRIMCSATGYKGVNFGSANGVPVTGDFDGDGIDDFGTYSAPSGEWQIRRSRDGDWSTQFGYDGTTPITGDFDGDTIIDFGCYYPPSGAWYIYKSSDGFWVNNFGYEGTTPVAGDFDGDGIDDFGCYYPPPGAWYVYKSSEGFWVNNFGYEGTVPMN